MNQSAQQILTQKISTSPISTRRILCVWLTHWPLQRLAATRAELNGRAVLIYEVQARRGLAVVSYSPRLGSRPQAAGNRPAPTTVGEACRIEPGMPLAEALALHQWASLRHRSNRGDIASSRARSVHLEAHDPLADRLALVQLAQGCHQFSPTVGLEEADRPESLLLDIGRVSERFGGEQALTDRLARSLAERGFCARLAVADSVGAAWGLAHYGRLSPIDAKHDNREQDGSPILASRLVIAPHGCLPRILADLPIAALRLDAKTLGNLEQLGVERVEQLAVLPRAGLATRFGHGLLRRLDEALAATAEVIISCRLPAELEAAWPFETPTSRQDEIEYVLAELLPRLTGPLARERRGVLELICRFDCQESEPCRVVLRLFRPSVSNRHLLDMFRLRLETVQLRSAITAIHLAVTASDRLQFEQQTLFAVESRQTDPRHLAQAVDRLTHRLGREAVLQPLFLADAQPEYACQYLPLTDAHKVGQSSPAIRNGQPTGRAKKNRSGKSRSSFFTPPPPPARPMRLYIPPLPLHNVAAATDGTPLGFYHQGSSQRVVQAWGPERIETGWWRSRLVRRDYYRVETITAERYWLFRCLRENRWFLQGAFD